MKPRVRALSVGQKKRKSFSSVESKSANLGSPLKVKKNKVEIVQSKRRSELKLDIDDAFNFPPDDLNVRKRGLTQSANLR